MHMYMYVKVITCSDDNDVRIWRVARSNKATQPGEIVGHCEEYTGKGSHRKHYVCIWTQARPYADILT